MLFHSDLSAATGSFFAAIREGMMPAISVKTMLIRTSIMPARHGRTAVSVSMPVSDRTIRFSGMHNSIYAIIPIAPAQKPIISVSALNTDEISRFDAPMERRIPISFVRSSTEI